MCESVKLSQKSRSVMHEWMLSDAGGVADCVCVLSFDICDRPPAIIPFIADKSVLGLIISLIAVNDNDYR